MFCVDYSASMSGATDFSEVNDGDHEGFEETAMPNEVTVEGHWSGKATPDAVKEQVLKHGSFDDMVAMVKGTNDWRQRRFAHDILDVLGKEISDKMCKT